MKKEQTKLTSTQLKRSPLSIRTQLRAGAWKQCGRLECDTQDKGIDPGICKSLRCR
jgi:hypothetical protein